MRKIIIFILAAGLWLNIASAQSEEGAGFSLDIESKTIPFPKILRPCVDLSGRGLNRQKAWPQGLAAPEVLDAWEKDIGFGGVYRLQYNLWEISQLKDKEAREKLLSNYDNIIRRISQAGGIVILDIFGTPAGLGKALDRKIPPWDIRGFKSLIKGYMRDLSCNKKYNIWYELWSGPDSDDFFLGAKQEYLNLYRLTAECVDELEAEFKIHIPLGGPSVSAWFQNIEGNTIATAERSLIYELIKFAARYHLPLDFISWHAYSSDSRIEQAATTYKKSVPALIRDWLSYFKFDKDTPLIIDEWNYDTNANLLPERQEKSYICASYILSRMKNMFEAGIDYQTYFSLEDFHDNNEGVARNVGLFGFEAEDSGYRGWPKSTYDMMKMLAASGQDVFVSGQDFNHDFIGVFATKGKDYASLIVYNYIDPDIALNYLSRNIAALNSAERKIILNIITSGNFKKILGKGVDISKIRATNRIRVLLKKALELNEQAVRFKEEPRNLKITIKNLKGSYLYLRYVIDSSCSRDCKFSPAEEKEIANPDLYQETLVLKPYSVNMLIFRQKPQEPAVPAAAPAAVEKEASS